MKIGEATKQMKTNDVLAGYATNDAFADEFAKYMKFGRRCTSANLSKCFVSKFKLADNTEIDATTLTTGAALGHATYTSNTVGIGLVNGTNMILAFDPACARIDPYNNTTDTTSCLAVIYDINGAGKPNKVGKDIALLNVAFGTGCPGVTIGGLCVSGSNVSYSGILAGPNPVTDTNYWQGANNACSALGMRMPTLSELNTIYANKTLFTPVPSGNYISSTVNASYGHTSVYFGNGSTSPWWEQEEFFLRCVK